MRRGAVIASAKRRLSEVIVPYRDQVLADGPLIYYRLSETSGAVAADAAPTPHPGTIVGTPTFGVPGGIASDTDTAMTFSGTQRITVANFTALNVSANYTAECLAKLTGTAINSLIDRDAQNTRQFQFRLNAGKIEAIVFSSNTVYQSLVSTGTYNDGNWHHFVLRRAGGAISLWADGVKVAESLTLTTAAVNGGGLMVGASNGGTAGIYTPLTGSIDEVAFYPTALADSRIQSHAQARAAVA